MGIEGSANSRRSRGIWPKLKTLPEILAVIGVSAAVVLAVMYSLAVPFRERHVSYEYTINIEPDGQGQFSVICPLPAKHDGSVNADLLSSVVVEGNVVVSEVTSLHGWGLQIVGNGSANITWDHHHAYRTSTQSIYDHYSNLSMLDDGYTRGSASVHLDGSNASFSLSYHYSHVFGHVGADFLWYEANGNLTDGWNVLQVDFNHMVS